MRVCVCLALSTRSLSQKYRVARVRSHLAALSLEVDMFMFWQQAALSPLQTLTAANVSTVVRIIQNIPLELSI